MSAVDLYAISAPFFERVQALLVGKALGAIDFHHSLIGTKTRRTAGARKIRFLLMEVGVASMEKPAVTLLDGDTGMAPGVPDEGNEQHLRR